MDEVSGDQNLWPTVIIKENDGSQLTREERTNTPEDESSCTGNITQDRPSKRDREEEDEGWTKVEKKSKKHMEGKTEIIISSNEKLPKQFAIAKLFTSLGFLDITKIKYINPYKLKLEVPSTDYAYKVIECEEFKSRSWRVQKATDVNFTYGIIRNVDLELNDKEILQAISCPNRIPIISVKRLNRRDSSGKWIPSEAARVTFNCTYLPAYVNVDNIHMKVEPYIFPTTQCSKCWEFGHSKNRCNSKKVVCPKCGGPHENCAVSTFKCVNCHGPHMALDRTCPTFMREKRLRELMAEYNCTYRIACNMYVVPESNHLTPHIDNIQQEAPKTDVYNSFDGLQMYETNNHKYTPSFPSYAQLFTPKRPKSQSSSTHNNYNSANKTDKGVSKSTVHQSERSYRHQESSNCIPEQSADDVGNESGRNMRGIHFSELLEKLRNIIFMRNISMNEMFKSVVKTCIEWLVLIIVDNISDWPVLNSIMEKIIKISRGF